MEHLQAALALAARNGRLILILGLIAGILLPGLAAAMAPFIGIMVAALLFLAALRIGPHQAFGALADIRHTALAVVALQCALPLAGIALIAAFDQLTTPLGLGLALMMAGSPISGAPHLAVMTGNDPAPALRQLILGTALLPLTVIPALWSLPTLGSPAEVARASLNLMILIVLSASAAFALRATILKEPSPATVQSIDGVSAIAMAVVVIGLMSAVGPALFKTPPAFLAMLGAVFAANLALQVATTLIVRWRGHERLAPSLGICAGNRNIAMFLAVLPAETTRDLLLFIGCYQVPMYMTPLILGRFYRPRGLAH
jgi:ACR3 family arsenite transporter